MKNNNKLQNNSKKNLLAYEQRYQELLKISSEVIFEIDNNLNITFNNKQALDVFLYKQEEINKGINLINIIAPEDLDRARENIKKIIATNNYSKNNYTFIRKNGSRFLATVNSSCIYDKHGKVLGLSGVLIDISEQQKLEAEKIQAEQTAEKANAAKSLFLANMSHELRTPLIGILGFSELIAKDPSTTTETREAGNIIHECGKKLLNIINNVLDIVYLDQVKEAIILESFDLDKLILKIILDNLPISNKNNNQVYYNYPDDMPRYFISDKHCITQIISNIFNNADKFTKNGTIKISVWYEKIIDDVLPVHIDISDTGIGIPETDLKNIFNIFYQEDNDYNKKQDGVGIGLSVALNLVSLLDGSIVPESIINKGSTFKIFLPLKINPEPMNNIISQTEKILIVEDDKASQLLAEKILQSEKYFIDTANDGEIALLMVQEKKYNLILMDIKMPKINGYETANQIRKLGIKTPIIAITALPILDDHQKHKESMDDYIAKPFEIETLKTKVRYWLNKQ